MKNLLRILTTTLFTILISSSLIAQIPNFTLPYSSSSGNPIHGIPSLTCYYDHDSTTTTNFECISPVNNTISLFDSVEMFIKEDFLNPWLSFDIEFYVYDRLGNPIQFQHPITGPGFPIKYHCDLSSPGPEFNVSFVVDPFNNSGFYNHHKIEFELDWVMDYLSITDLPDGFRRGFFINHRIKGARLAFPNCHNCQEVFLTDLSDNICTTVFWPVCCEGGEPCPPFEGGIVDPDPIGDTGEPTNQERMGLMNGDKPTVYPNPFVERTILNIPVSSQEDFQIHIFDLQGKMIDFTSKQIEQTSKGVSVEINLKNAPAGIYFAKVSGTTYNSLYKLMKSNYCLLYTSPSPRDRTRSRMPSSA